MTNGFTKTGADRFSLILPICCFITIFFTLSYWAKISNEIWQQEYKELLNKLTVTYAIEIENQIKHTLSPHRLIEQRIINQQGELSNISELVNDMLAHHRDILRISFSPNNTTTAVFPQSNNQHLIGLQISLAGSDEHATDQTLISNQRFFSAPVKNDNNNVLFSINNPVYIGEKFWGYVSYQINISDIVNQVQLPQIVPNQHSYQLSHISNHHKLTILAHSEQPLGHQVYSALVEVPENNWLLEISFSNKSITTLTTLGILFRLLVTSVMTLVIYWALQEPRRLRRQLDKTTGQLSTNTTLLQSVLDNVNDGVIVCNNAGKVYLTNNAARRLYNITDDKQLDINSSCFQFCADDDSQTGPSDGLFHKALYRNEEVEQDIKITSDEGLSTTLKAQSKILHDVQRRPVGAMLFVQDITELKQVTNANTSRNIILDMLARDKPINEIFEHIIHDIESSVDNLSGAISLLDDTKTRFVDVVAPQLPAFFTDSLNGLKIGERVMSCASAIHHNKMIIVEDVRTHPYWIDYKDLALQAHIRSSWSQPIHSANGELLGSFDIYSNHVNLASPDRVLALKEAATLTALTIERHRDGQRLQKILLAVQHSPNPLLILDNHGVIDYVNPKFCEKTGYQPVELIGIPLENIVPITDNKLLYQEVISAIKAGKDWCGKIKIIKKNGDIYWAYDHVSVIKDDTGNTNKFVIIHEGATVNCH